MDIYLRTKRPLPQEQDTDCTAGLIVKQSSDVAPEELTANVNLNII